MSKVQTKEELQVTSEVINIVTHECFEKLCWKTAKSTFTVYCKDANENFINIKIEENLAAVPVRYGNEASFI